jgi:CHAT domain-containing protein/tetratricopeptide (TPR) repeat protein
MKVISLLVVAAVTLTGQNPGRQAELDAAFQKGVALRKTGKDADAIPHLARALELAPEVFGPDHLNTAGIANTLGHAQQGAGLFADAAKSFQLCQEIREKRLGNKDDKVAVALNNLAMAYRGLARAKEAIPLFERALAIREAGLPANHLDIALILNNLAGAYQELGQDAKALTVLEKSLRITEAQGKDSAAVASVLLNLANATRRLGRAQEAESLARRSLNIRETVLGKDDLRTAEVLNWLGDFCQETGRLSEAEPLFRRCLTIRQARLNDQHPLCASVTRNLGILLWKTGRFSESDAMFQRSLAICERAFGKEHPEVAEVLQCMGLLYGNVGRTREAEQFYRRSIAIRETKVGKNDPHLASTCNNLAALLASMGQTDEAERLYRRSLTIGEAAYGKDSTAVAVYLTNLAVFCLKTGRLKEAESSLLRALPIFETRYGKESPRLAFPLTNLGSLYRRMNQLDKAAAFLERSLDLLHKGQDQEREGLTAALNLLAIVYQLQGQHEKAWQLETQHAAMVQKDLDNVVAFNSETAMHRYLETISGVLPNLVSMAAEQRDRADVASDALTWTLRLKGIAMETLCRYHQAQNVLAPNDPVTRRVSRYQSLKKTLTDVALNPPQNLSRDQLARQTAQWRLEAESLEREINRALGARFNVDATKDATAAELRLHLGPDAALVEFVRVPVRDFTRNSAWKPAHYFAFVLGADRAPTRLIDLGPAQTIDDVIEAVRKEFTDFQDRLRECETAEDIVALEKAQEKQFAKVSGALYRLVFAPLRQALGPARLVYLAPDAALNRLPFEVLVDDGGKYLVETYRCAYLSSGRDLLRPALASAQGTVVFAGPDFKMNAQERLAQADNLLHNKQVLAMRGSAAGEVRSIGWKALPGAAAEAKDIQQILDGSGYAPVKAYVGRDALEEVLKAMPAPRVLHLATHGFFLDKEPPSSPSAAEDGAGAGWARGRLKQMDNPLLRSGIVLAGANAVGDKDSRTGAEDGWVTAEEIALLNLRGTELVVLSACQTGLGDVKSGEGVFGLRRAFLFAGARTLVTSLFEVPDKDTRELMKAFYSGLKSGHGKLAALHTAELSMLQRRRQSGGAAHPFFWASFVMVGDVN